MPQLPGAAVAAGPPQAPVPPDRGRVRIQGGGGREPHPEVLAQGPAPAAARAVNGRIVRRLAGQQEENRVDLATFINPDVPGPEPGPPLQDAEGYGAIDSWGV